MIDMLIAAVAAASNPMPQMGWMTGYWLSCAGGREVSETWGDPHENVLLGSSMTISEDGKTRFEVMRIAPTKRGLTFFAQPSGRPAAEFRLKSATETEMVFENLSHDFPQRIIYRREGDQLVARIEGKIGDKTDGSEWRYASAPLNSSCSKEALAQGATPTAAEPGQSEPPPAAEPSTQESDVSEIPSPAPSPQPPDPAVGPAGPVPTPDPEPSFRPIPPSDPSIGT